MKFHVPFLYVLASVWYPSIPLAQPGVFLPDGDAIEVAGNEWGNKAIRMVVNASGEPVIAFGTNGHLYVARWETQFDHFAAPVELDASSNVFMSDAEGPRMAAQGDYLVIAYQISGDWENGARSIHSWDGGLTWSDPVEMVQGATEDHFMPCVAVDGNGNPFAGLKVGNNLSSIYEGVLVSQDGGNAWSSPSNASESAEGSAVCNCCPSQPFFAADRYYDVVRNNNMDLRDFWLLSSADGVTWDGAVDVDPLDWVINSCPESGPSVAGPVEGTHYWIAYMSAGGATAQSRVYVSEVDVSANGGSGEWLQTQAVTLDQFSNATQNSPSLAHWSDGISEEWMALAWEQNSGGYDIQMAITAGGEVNWMDVAQNITADQSGQHRKPAIACSTDENGAPRLHLAWQHSTSGTVQYLAGTIVGPTAVRPLARHEPQIKVEGGSVIVQVSDAWAGGLWRLFDSQGRLVQSGRQIGVEPIRLPTSALPKAAILSLERLDGVRWARTLVLGVE